MNEAPRHASDNKRNHPPSRSEAPESTATLGVVVVRKLEGRAIVAKLLATGDDHPVRKTAAEEDQPNKSIMLNVVPCLNGFIVRGDVVICR